jgi:hypothetical protein|nr:MAG TPA: capsid assembly protein [Caudoviricetes sp.]
MADETTNVDNTAVENTDVEVKTSQNITIEAQGDTHDSTTPNEEQAEPTGQDVDANVQQRIDAQTQANTDLKNDLSNKGVDWNVLEKEYTDNGELSKESLEALEKAGYPKSVVDAYINGMEAEYERLANHVVESVGGVEQFTKLQNFAKTQNADYQKMWNDTMNSGNVLAIKTMLSGIQSDMIAVQGTQKSTIMGSGSTGAGSGDTGFSSKQDMIKAMSDPRYGKDKAYTHAVEQKVINSKLF